MNPITGSNAHFPCDGRNHRAAENAQKQLGKEYKYELERVYKGPIEKVIQEGGTVRKADVKIHTKSGERHYASLKVKNNIKNGSFDWVNTTTDLRIVFPEAYDVYDHGKDSGNKAMAKCMVEAISKGWSRLTTDQVTELIRKHVVQPYLDENCELLIQDKGQCCLYRINPLLSPLFEYIQHGGKLNILPSKRQSAMSRQIGGTTSNGAIIDFGIRVRFHLNNGYGAWHKGDGPRKNPNSYLCFKVQQDNVKGFLKQCGQSS